MGWSWTEPARRLVAPTSPSTASTSSPSGRTPPGLRCAPSRPRDASSRPGWVDIHTHYDGQATWDPDLAPSSVNGVTSLVMGNCGVGFAPARPDRHAWLIALLEGVEDIPGTALHEDLSWGWESFGEYLD